MTPNSPSELPQPVSISPASTGEPPMRLARLRAEFAHLYAGLDPRTWYPAASVAAYFRSWLSRHPDRGRGREPLRGLETAHFDFRGGTPREAPWLQGESTDERRPSSSG